MPEPRRNKREFYRSVFRKTISFYDELVVSNGTNSCEGLYKSMNKDGSRIKYNPKIIRATTSDFVCDVEVAAKQTLSKEEHRFFSLVYIKKDQEICDLLKDKSPNNKFNKLKQSLQEKLGQAFKVRGLYPMAKYFKSKDLR
jgi:hypothetical protein